MYILFKGIFDTTDLLTDEIISSFKRRGVSFFVVRADSLDKSIRELKTLIAENKRIDGVITFNNIGYFIEDEKGENIFDKIDAPFFDVLLDHPFHYLDKIKKLPKNTVLCCIDKNHADFVKRFLKNIKDVRFTPHFGCLYAAGEPSKNELKRDERDIDILYAGSLSRVLIEQLIPDFSEYKEIDGVSFSESVLKKLINNPDLTTEAVIESELKTRLGREIPDDELLSYIEGFRFLDGFSVSYFRELSVRILCERGFKVNVLGLGWEMCDWAENENLIHMGKCDAADVLSYMKRSKVILNTLTWFKDGAHDRIFNGMLSGAAVLTDGSKYLKSVKNIEVFKLNELNALPKLTNSLLSDDELWYNFSRKGRIEAEENHTVENFIENLAILPKINI